jgi:hypothetical protein
MAQHRQTAPHTIRARTLIGGVLAAGTMVLGAGSIVLAAPAGIALAEDTPPATETTVPPVTETTVPPPPTETTVPPPTPAPTTTVPPPTVGNGNGIGSGGVPGVIGELTGGNGPVSPGSVFSDLAKAKSPGSSLPDTAGIEPGQAVKGVTPGAGNGAGSDAP